ncbi:MAG TPA: TraR/DksA C4-type zinc finger protein [Candidatus Paceibacterota bacterium]|nr:TraR/DksA C4-type zinc finger protein [Candidatus Paceibacterota bacterium]
MISKENLKELESLLKEEKKRLEKEIKGVGSADLGDDTDHLEEEADESEQVAINEGITVSLKDSLKDISLALDKMGAGAYGVCEECGSEISLELLKADPESRLCQSCKLKEAKEEE